MRPRHLSITAGVLLCAVAAGIALAQPVRIVAPGAADPPIEFGLAELRAALARAGYTAAEGDAAARAITVATAGQLPAGDGLVVPATAEAFVLRVEPSTGDWERITVAGRDAAGTMYGCLELAEQIDVRGSPRSVVRSPLVEIRAVNPFLTVEALHDPTSWFYDTAYWMGFFDQLARARLNWLDLHAVYDLDETSFYNLFPYFVVSARFPEVGIPEREKRRNLEALNRIVRLARARGVRVALMSYAAGWSVPGRPQVPYENSEQALGDYTREVVAGLLRDCPGLEMIGFRIGESGQNGPFYADNFLAGVAVAGRPVVVYTRSWLAQKSDVERIALRHPGRTLLEVKFNGEHYAAPYQVTGGLMAQFASYSYESYSSLPRRAQLLYQVRANGTHRVFPWGHPGMVRTSCRASLLAGGAGYSVEPLSAYYPQRNYLLNDRYPQHDYFSWTWERDWFYYQLWGRLGYDPDVPDDVWRHAFRRRFGAEAGAVLYDVMVRRSTLLPLLYSYHWIGPDHRSTAPELECCGPTAGGSVNIVRRQHLQPLEQTAYLAPYDWAKLVVGGTATAKQGPLEVARRLDGTAGELERLLAGIGPVSATGAGEAFCMDFETRLLCHLARYHADKNRASAFHALYEQTGDQYVVDRAVDWITQAAEHWRALAVLGAEHYDPFPDALMFFGRRPKGERAAPPTEYFTWAGQLPLVEADTNRLVSLQAEARRQKPDRLTIAHAPPGRRPAHRNWPVYATVRGADDPVVLLYLLPPGAPQPLAFPLRREREGGELWTTVVSQEFMQPGPMEYWFVALDGDAQARAPRDDAERPFIVRGYTDREGPRIFLQPGGNPLPPSASRVAEISFTVIAVVRDPSGIEAVHVVYKRMPSDAPWQSMPMRYERAGAWAGVHVAEIPMYPEGLQYQVVAVDLEGNGMIAPDPASEIPYISVDGWVGPRAD